MTTSVLVVGVEPILSQFLTTQGFSVTNLKPPSVEQLCDVLSLNTFDALLFGPTTHFNTYAIAYIRQQGYSLAVLRVEYGPRTREWSHTCVDFLEAGGDNMILAPADPEEVARCIGVAVRHASKRDDDIISFANHKSSLSIDNRRKSIVVDGSTVFFTAAEFILLHILATTKGPLSFSKLLEHIKGDESTTGHSNVLSVMVCRVRKKIGEAVQIVTRRGTGYELIPNNMGE